MEKEDKMQEESSTSKGWPTGEGQLQEGTNVNSDCTDPPRGSSLGQLLTKFMVQKQVLTNAALMG